MDKIEEFKQLIEKESNRKVSTTLQKRGSLKGYATYRIKGSSSLDDSKFDFNLGRKLAELYPGTEQNPNFFSPQQFQIYVGLTDIHNKSESNKTKKESKPKREKKDLSKIMNLTQLSYGRGRGKHRIQGSAMSSSPIQTDSWVELNEYNINRTAGNVIYLKNGEKISKQEALERVNNKSEVKIEKLDVDLKKKNMSKDKECTSCEIKKDQSYFIKIKGTNMYLGSPSMIKKDKLWVPNYEVNKGNAAVVNGDQVDEYVKDVPLKKEAFEFELYKSKEFKEEEQHITLSDASESLYNTALKKYPDIKRSEIIRIAKNAARVADHENIMIEDVAIAINSEINRLDYYKESELKEKINLFDIEQLLKSSVNIKKGLFPSYSYFKNINAFVSPEGEVLLKNEGKLKEYIPKINDTALTLIRIGTERLSRDGYIDLNGFNSLMDILRKVSEAKEFDQVITAAQLINESSNKYHDLIIMEPHTKEINAMDSFQLGTPATYKGESGEVIMNKETINHRGGGVSKPGTIKGISLYKNENYSGNSERFVVPDSWLDVKKFSSKNKFLTDYDEIIEAMTDLASKSESNIDFIKKVISGFAESFGVDIMSQEFQNAMDMVKGDTEGNKRKLKNFYLSQGLSRKDKRKSDAKEAETEFHVNKIIDMAEKANKEMENTTESFSDCLSRNGINLEKDHHRFEFGTKIKDNVAGTTTQVQELRENDVLLSYLSALGHGEPVRFNVTYSKLIEAFKAGEITVHGFESEEKMEFARVLHAVQSCHEKDKLRAENGYLKVENQELKKPKVEEKSYDDWLEDLTYKLEVEGELTRSDAQGFLEAHEADIAQEWSKGSDAKTAASNMLNKDIKVKKEHNTSTKIGQEFMWRGANVRVTGFDDIGNVEFIEVDDKGMPVSGTDKKVSLSSFEKDAAKFTDSAPDIKETITGLKTLLLLTSDKDEKKKIRAEISALKLLL